MKTILITLIAALCAVALLMAGLGIKLLVKRRGEFKRHCASMDPYTGERPGCVCGDNGSGTATRKRGDSCCRRYQPLEVNEALREEVK